MVSASERGLGFCLSQKKTQGARVNIENISYFEQSGWRLGGQAYKSKWLVKQEELRGGVLKERENKAKGQKIEKDGGRREASRVAGP